MAVVNDRKTPVPKASPNEDEAEYFMPTVLMEMDYFPFGMQLYDPTTLTLDGEYRFGFGGHELDNEIKGTGNHYSFGDFGYDPRLGRRWNTDPLAHLAPGWTPYRAFFNNPIYFIDPTGLSEIDFYDQSGSYLGNDGNTDDGRVAIVTDRREARSIKRADSRGETTPLSNINSAVEIPNKSIRSKMMDVISMDEEEPFREYGGFFGFDENTGLEQLVWAKPGEKGDPSKVKEVSINVFNPADPEAVGNISIVSGTFHTHPSGTVTEYPGMNPNIIGGVSSITHGFVQTPSAEDIRTAAARSASGIVTGNSYVLGMGSKTVYIYNGSGTQATFPLSLWGTVGR